VLAAIGDSIVRLCSRAVHTVASTTSTEESGLFGSLLPTFTKKTGIQVRVVAVGTGQALKIGEHGDCDVVFVHDRPAEGLAVGHLALHVYLTDYLRVELLGKWGSDNYQDNSATAAKPYNYVGARPVAILDLGWFKFKVGAEHQKRSAVFQTVGGDPGQPQAKKDPIESLTSEGVGASVQFIIDPIVEFGVNAAIGKEHYIDPSANNFGSADTLAKSHKTSSVGGFANARLADGWLAGAGANFTQQTDDYQAPGSTANDYTSQLLGFVSLQYLLARQLYIKAEFAYASALFQPSDFVPSWHNTMYSGGVRLMYLY